MNEDNVLVRRTAGTWAAPETMSYDNEEHLQQILHDDPTRVPRVNGNPTAVMELSTSAGPIDVSIVDDQGQLTVVECKLASNSERRRMVIGQVIDYASAIWQDGVESFLAAWSHRGGENLAESLSADAYAQLRSNIVGAHINLCLAVDQIDGDLRRLVEYLNRVTDQHISVTALQLAYARDGDVEILIPSTFGAELAAAKKHQPSAARTPWNRERFLEALTSTHRTLAEELLERLHSLEQRGTHDPIRFGTYPRGGIDLHPYGLRRAPISVWANSKGELLVYGTWNAWSDTAGHRAFADLARLLGQEHTSTNSRGVPVASLDLDALWSATLACALALPGEPQGPT